MAGPAYGVTDEDEPRPFSFKSGRFLVVHPFNDKDETPAFKFRCGPRAGAAGAAGGAGGGEMCAATSACCGAPRR
jgi:hypothetical protein